MSAALILFTDNYQFELFMSPFAPSHPLNPLCDLSFHAVSLFDSSKDIKFETFVTTLVIASSPMHHHIDHTLHSHLKRYFFMSLKEVLLY